MDNNDVRGVEWVILGFSGCCTVFAGFGTAFTVPQVSQRAFNDVWVVRFIIQFTAMVWAVSQLLPLQLLWDPVRGILSFLPSSFESQVMCKVFTVVSLGICQPLLLFLAATLCRFAIRGGLIDKGATWRTPLRQAAMLTIPFTGLQILSAWWASWLSNTVDANGEAGKLPFSSFMHIRCPDGAKSDHGGPPPPGALECIACQYGINSIAVLTLFTVIFITLILWHGRTLVQHCGNATLRRRISLLCVLVPVLQIVQLGACCLSLASHPLAWLFEMSKFVAVLCVLAMLTSICSILVLIPLRAAQQALRVLPSKLETTGVTRPAVYVEDKSSLHGLPVHNMEASERQESLHAPLRALDFDYTSGKSGHSDGLPMIPSGGLVPTDSSQDCIVGSSLTGAPPPFQRHAITSRTHERNISWESASSLLGAGQVLLDTELDRSSDTTFVKTSR